MPLTKAINLFTGHWVNGYGDTLSLHPLFFGLYLLSFRIVSTGEPRRRIRIAIRKGNELSWSLATFSQSYHITCLADGTLLLETVPEMGEHIATVDWIRWDVRGCSFAKAE